MQIFPQLKDIIEKKSGNLLATPEDEQEFQPYIVSRWLSMHSNQYCELINLTTNRLYSGIQSKDQWYQLLSTLLPKDRYRYIKYIKKTKTEKTPEDSKYIKLFARDLEISEREVIMYINSGIVSRDYLKNLYNEGK